MSINDSIIEPLLPFHPYHPIGLALADYLSNDIPVPVLLGVFAAGCAAIILTTRYLLQSIYPLLKDNEKAAVWWFIFSGSIHLFFEGYFSINHTRIASSQALFSQLWKEYALADSRYLTSDPFVLCMETMTAFIMGPLCYTCAAMTAVRHPLHHPLQIIVCVGQIYGLILYYATSMFDHYYFGLSHSRPEFLYFWIYYFFINFLWMVVPGLLLYKSTSTIARVFQSLETTTTKIHQQQQQQQQQQIEKEKIKEN